MLKMGSGVRIRHWVVAHMIGRLSVRHAAAAGVAAVGIEAAIGAIAPNDHARRHLLERVAVLPSAAHVLAVVVGLALLVLAPKLWRGTRAAVALAIAALGLLAIFDVVKGPAYGQAVVALGLALMLVRGRRAFPLGSRSRPRAVVVFAAAGTWALAYCVVLAGRVLSDRGRTIRRALHHAIGHVVHGSLAPARPAGAWTLVAELLIGCAAAISLLALRSLLRPAVEDSGHGDHEYRAARAAVERYGEDSLSPFILRPDKSFHFDDDGVLAYRLIGETAVISGDPVAADGQAPRLLSGFRELARRQGWEVAVWGASDRHLEAYRRLGLQAVCAGLEAFVDPAAFTLEGRRVRKLRQSVVRVDRRGWGIDTFQGRELDDALGCEIDAFEADWRRSKPRLLGFAMGMGAFEAEGRPDDLYLLARSPEGQLCAVMRFVSHCGRLSLDTMHRLHETPNGLNEALVCRALAVARERRVPQVSLNYAGLGHLVRDRERCRGATGRLQRVALGLLGRRFQMDRLVRFNEKFSPDWRPRYLVYEARAGLVRSTLRVLQAEGHLPQRRPRLARGAQLARRSVHASRRASAAA